MARRSRALMARVQLIGSSVAQWRMVRGRDPWGPELPLWSLEGPCTWDGGSGFTVYYKAQIIKHKLVSCGIPEWNLLT